MAERTAPFNTFICITSLRLPQTSALFAKLGFCSLAVPQDLRKVVLS